MQDHLKSNPAKEQTARAGDEEGKDYSRACASVVLVEEALGVPRCTQRRRLPAARRRPPMPSNPNPNHKSQTGTLSTGLGFRVLCIYSSGCPQRRGGGAVTVRDSGGLAVVGGSGGRAS
jgi:hypothetical protein